MRHVPFKWDGPLLVMKAGNHEQTDFKTSLVPKKKKSRKVNNYIIGQENNIKFKAKYMFIKISFPNSIVLNISQSWYK